MKMLGGGYFRYIGNYYVDYLKIMDDKSLRGFRDCLGVFIFLFIIAYGI